MAITTFGSIGTRAAAFAAKTHLEHAAPIEVLARFGDIKPMPKNATGVIKFRRPVPFPAATTPLTEGVTPAGTTMQYQDVTVTLNQYGDFVEITDVIQDMAEDPVLKDASMMCGEQAAQTKEQILWGVLKAGTNKFYGGTATSEATVGAGMVLTRALQRNITKSLKANKARKVTQMISASPNYATQPVDAAYLAFCHTDLEGTIRDMQGFTPVEQYGNMKALPYEIGKVEDVRYIASPELSPNAGAGAGGIDVYQVVYVGKHAYGDVAMRGSNGVKIMALTPNVARGGDPLGQKGTVGWKTYAAPVVLNQAWMAVASVSAV